MFKGMFLAEKIESHKYNNWYLNPICNFCNPVIPKDNEVSDNNTLPNIVSEPIVKAYPNPFSEKTNLTFVLPQDNHVTLGVYELSGKLIATLFNGDVTQNQEYKVEFDGSSLATGIYMYKMTTNDNVFTGKMILNKE
jgi:hypothetical protein